MSLGIPYDTRLPANLRALQQEIEGYAREYGLDFYETIFEVLDADDLNEVAAYGGFPTRYPHWSFGMAYEELRKSYEYGLSKIYEMVINNDPCYAYLMRCNHVVDQKLVMAHVYGHCLAPETRIVTADGEKPITAVKAGDQVLTHRGAWRRVRVCARRRFKGKIHRLSIDRSSERVRITGEHPVYVFPERSPARYSCKGFSPYLPAWIPAAQLRVGTLLVLGEVPTAARGSLMAAGDDPERLAWGGTISDELRARVTAIETEDYDGDVYNFSVEEDESYTLAAGFVVHNCDFFKNNAYFAHTNRKMMDEMANHGARVRRYVEKYGEDEVEAFLDKCKSIEDLIDIHSVAIKRRDEVSRYDFTPEKEDEPVRVTRLKSKGYMDPYINPEKLLKEEEEERKKLKEQTAKNFPEQPEKDVLLFLIEYAPLKSWQRDVLSIIREEAYYFMPQAQTKILNEGWASYWHSTIMTQKSLHPSEVVDYCDHHSGTMASYGVRLNPYKLGIELLRDIERRWNTGQFGKEWEECDDLEAKRKWDKQLGLGRQKIFEVRRTHNDITFIDTFLTPEFCAEQKYFSFLYQEQAGTYVIDSREFQKIKQRLLFNLTNFGKPFIYVVDGNYRNRGELLLRHEYNGIDLKLDWASDVLANIQHIWSRPVHLQTVVDNKPTLLSFDGTDHTMKALGESDDPRRHAAGKTR
jgi:stage V sporulation protein R